MLSATSEYLQWLEDQKSIWNQTKTLSKVEDLLLLNIIFVNYFQGPLSSF